ncbi:MAG: aldehyde dehydrogenase family protein [Burkholderiales bacterium]
MLHNPMRFVHFIDNESVPADGGESLPVVDPSTGAVFAQIARGGAADVDRAVRAARAAFQGPWGRLSAVDRGRLLRRWADAVEAHADELAQLESQDTGKPLKQARADALALARYFEFYSGAADKLHGQTIPYQDGYTVLTIREPHGVTGHIVPWNYPMQIFGRSVGAALAAGNACVVKPAEDACLSLLRVASLAAAVGFPAGSLNIVTGLGPAAGQALAEHPGIDHLSFTGSTETGRRVAIAGAGHHCAVTLELGGKSPQIVFDDVDVERAVPIVVRAIVQNAGQTCTAGSRLLVQRSIHDAFVARVAEAFAKVRVGTPEMDLDCGPVMNPAQQRRVQRYVDGAKAAGIPVIAQGRIADGVPPGGYWVTPTLFGPVPRDAAIAREEVFGPVLAAMSFEDEADAIRLANGTDYGLLAAVWTGNSGRLHRVAKAVRAGQVFMNCYGAGGGVELPFGGTKRSGHGREKGLLALEELSTTKTLVHWHG